MRDKDQQLRVFNTGVSLSCNIVSFVYYGKRGESELSEGVYIEQPTLANTGGIMGRLVIPRKDVC